MGATDRGTQLISIDYKEALLSETANYKNYEVIPTGVYTGLDVQVIDTSTARITAGVAFIQDQTKNLAIKMETTADIVNQDMTLPGKPYVIARLNWLNVANNYVDFLSEEIGNIVSTDIILARGVYSGASLISIDYAVRQVSGLQEVVDKYDEFLVTASSLSYDGDVDVSAGKAVINNRYVDFAGGSIAVPNTASGTGRSDVIYLSDAGVLGITVGSLATPSIIPDCPSDSLLLAVIQRTGGSAITIVTGADITNTVNLRNSGSLTKQLYVEDVFNDDETAEIGDIYTGDGELFEMTSPSLGGNKGSVPTFMAPNVSFIGNNGFGKMFSNRGNYYLSRTDDGGYILLPNQLYNQGFIEFYIYPDWNAADTDDQYLFDNRMLTGSDTDDVLRCWWEASSRKFRVAVQTSSGNAVDILSATFADNAETVSVADLSGLQQALHFKIAWDQAQHNNGVGVGEAGVYFSINNVEMNGTGQTTKTKTSNGILGLDLTTRTGLAVGAQAAVAGTEYIQNITTWMQDLLIDDIWDVNETHYTTGKPYITLDRIMGKNTYFSLDKDGSLGAKTGFFNDVYSTGDIYANSLNVQEITGIDLSSLTHGNNTDGYYEKFDDGLLICHHRFLTNISGTAIWTFPYAFVDTNYSVAGMPCDDGYDAIEYVVVGLSSTQTGIISFATTTGNFTARDTRLIAIGRWK